MTKKLTKRQAVRQFVALCIAETLAGDWMEYYADDEFMEHVPDGALEMYRDDDDSILLDFGGDTYRLKFIKVT